MGKEDTRKLIIAKARELFAEFGYEGISTKEIAKQAGVSEMTLFRHFGSKEKLLENVLDTPNVIKEINEIFISKVKWDIEEDLLYFFDIYEKLLFEQIEFMEIVIKLNQKGVNLEPFVLKNALEVKEKLTIYFTRMIEEGKVIDTDPDVLRQQFMFLCVSTFTTLNILKMRATRLFSDDIGRKNVISFIKSIKK